VQLQTEWNSDQDFNRHASFDDFNYGDEGEEFIHWPRDPKLDPTKDNLMH